MTLSRSGYLPLAFGVKDWRKEDQYPALKPLDNYTRDDYLPLAWELPRRMPRYRRQYRTISTDPLSVQSVALIVKRAANAMGREREEFSGPQPSRRLRDPGGDGIWLATITLGADGQDS